jgi:hypothetical protein
MNELTEIQAIQHNIEILKSSIPTLKGHQIALRVYLESEVKRLEEQLAELQSLQPVDFTLPDGSTLKIDPDSMYMNHVEFEEGPTFKVPVFLTPEPKVMVTTEVKKPKRKYTKKKKTDVIA